MRIGICTTDFDRAYPALELFEKVAGLGFECVQLAFGSVLECGFTASNQIEIPGFVPEDALEAIRTASEKTGVSIVAVNGTWNMAHPDRKVREEGLRRFGGFLDAVKALNCPIASLCTGSRSLEHLWKYDPETQTNAAWDDMADSMARSVAMAEERGVTLAIETEATNVIHSPERARRILDEIHSSNLKMILDCANLFHAGEASEETMRPTIDRAMANFGRDIVLAHGKDIQPSEGICFCGTGFGIVDFPYMLDTLKKTGYAGDMVLHGIYREEDMPGCLAFMKNCLYGKENPA